MVENRKYNREEIKYVLSRVLAKWKPDIIAKAFKKDHGQYWANREFTKKQVNYIRTNYKAPWGDIEPYDGPIPHFKESTSPQRRSSIMTQQQSKVQTMAHLSAANSTSGTPYRFQHHQLPVKPQDEDRRNSASWPASPFLNTDAANQLLLSQEPANSLATTAGLGLGPENSIGLDTFGTELGCPTVANGMTTHGLPLLDEPNGLFDTSPPDFFGLGAQFDQGGNDLLRATCFGLDAVSPLPDLDFLDGLDLVEFPDLPKPPTLLNVDIPIPSTERDFYPATKASARADDPGGADDPSLPRGQAPQSLPPSQAPFPPGCTGAKAAKRDPFGVWYYGAHDACAIALGHRHDAGGGIYFTSELSVAQSFLAMYQHEGIGFTLGLAAAAKRLQDKTGAQHHQPQALWQRATQLARDSLPDGKAALQVPDGDTVVRMCALNRQLPLGHFFDPFSRTVVRYHMPTANGLKEGR